MPETPTVNYPLYLGRMFGLAESRYILSPQQFDAAYKEIRAEYDAEERGQTAFIMGETKPATEEQP